MSEKKIKSRLLFFIIVLAIILRCIRLNKNIFMDSAFTLFYASHPLDMVWKVGLAEPHPPTYNYLMHFMLKISTNLVFLRISSVIFGVLTVYVVYLIGRKLFNNNVGILAALMLAINPLHIQMSQRLRMYSLMTLCLILTYYFLLERKWVMYIIFGALSVWVEYFSVLPLGIIMINSLFRERFSKKIFIINILSILFIAPISFFLIKSFGALPIISHVSSYWVFFILPYIFSTYVLGYFNPYFINRFPVINPVIIGLILSLLFFIFLLYKFAKQRKRVLELGFLILAPILIPYFLDSILHIQLEAMRFMFGLGLLCIAFSKGLYTLKKPRFILGIFLLLLITIVPLYYLYKQDYTDWKGASSYIEKNEKLGDIILVVQNGVEVPFKFYYLGNLKIEPLPEQINYTDQWLWPEKRAVNQSNINNIKHITEGYQRVWLVENRIQGFVFPENIVVNYLKNDYYIVDIMHFTHDTLKVYLFERKEKNADSILLVENPLS